MKNELILFETADKEIKLNVSVKDSTVWLNRNQLAELFERDVKTIGTVSYTHLTLPTKRIV